jgi:NAD(P)-dependent dehydrogenase (short-subunit alcohol dehydrogenase family)
VKAIGPLVLFQASYEFLKASSPAPKFIIISSLMGSITFATKFPTHQLPYGASKSAVNWIASELHHDYPPFGMYMHICRSR